MKTLCGISHFCMEQGGHPVMFSESTGHTTCTRFKSPTATICLCFIKDLCWTLLFTLPLTLRLRPPFAELIIKGQVPTGHQKVSATTLCQNKVRKTTSHIFALPRTCSPTTKTWKHMGPTPAHVRLSYTAGCPREGNRDALTPAPSLTLALCFADTSHGCSRV